MLIQFQLVGDRQHEQVVGGQAVLFELAQLDLFLGRQLVELGRSQCRSLEIHLLLFLVSRVGRFQINLQERPTLVSVQLFAIRAGT